jgi:Subtilase family
MASSNDHKPAQPRRPMFAGGERLKGKAERPPMRPSAFTPYTAEEVFKNLSPQANRLRQETVSLPASMRGEHVIMEATLYPNYVANSHFLESTFKTHGLYVVGTRLAYAPYKTAKNYKDGETTKAFLVAGEPNNVISLAEDLLDGPGGKKLKWDEICRLYGVGLPDPSRVVRRVPAGLRPEQAIAWEAILSPIGRTEAEKKHFADVAFDRWTRLVESLGGEVGKTSRRTIDGLTFVSFRLSVEGTGRAASFNLLRNIRPIPQIRPIQNNPLRAALPLAHVPPDVEPMSSERVAIIDGGVASCPALNRFVTQYHLTPEAPDAAFVDHGSTVTSAFLFGNLDGKKQLPRPPAAVDHFRVFPPPAAELDGDPNLPWLLDQITSVVKQRRHRLFNISLGPDVCTDEDEVPHAWTLKLDQLAREHKVTFVVAAGNNGEEDQALGYNRVQAPADMINGIGVGACRFESSSEPLERASYSAMGPGRYGQIVQPIGVAFGGDFTAKAFVGFNHSGRLQMTSGTSFATPLVARGVAELHGGLGVERSTPDVTRAFAAHFAVPKKQKHDVLELGYGRLPVSYAHIWECAPNECVVLYQDTLRRAETIAMHLPFPRGLDDGVLIELVWTIAFTSTTDPANAAEYSRDGLELHFRPNENLRAIKDPATGLQIAQLDIARRRVELDALSQKQAIDIGSNPLSDSRWHPKSNGPKRRGAGQWETLLRGRIPRIKTEELFLPRLDINYLHRAGGRLEHRTAPLAVTMLVTMRAPVKVPLYDAVRNQFQVLTPLVNQLSLPGAA